MLYDSKDLTTHAVCVGMTGSGKTGLCLSLLEEAAIDGIPAICIDPKGDLGNLLLTFPNLAPADFEPWVDAGDAARKGVSVRGVRGEDRRDLEERPGRVGPGARTHRQASRRRRCRHLHAGRRDRPAAVRAAFVFAALARVAGRRRARCATASASVVSGLLSLLGIEADPIGSREHILLANILEGAWRAGLSLDMTGLIQAVQKPAFDKLGAFDLETFFPAKDRLKLAMQINNLIASPGFAAWMQGEPLDAQRLLFTPEGKPRISIISIAHLNDAERMFIVTLVLNEVIAWMRSQSGTGSLRAILYMDEIFGFFPPTANPPSKQPMLTLLKQARAFGLGVVLATQNPVDLDYKGLANCGTWFIGRLQTERDKLRVIEGLKSALAGAEDGADLEALMSSLTQRVFLMRNVHDDAPVLMKTRWALSYLRGPLTGPEIARVMAPRKARERVRKPWLATSSGSRPAAAQRGGRSAPARRRRRESAEYFLQPTTGRRVRALQAHDRRLREAAFRRRETRPRRLANRGWLAPFDDGGGEASWEDSLEQRAATEVTPGHHACDDAEFGDAARPALRAASYGAWAKKLQSHLYETARTKVLWSRRIQGCLEAGRDRGRLPLTPRRSRRARSATPRSPSCANAGR